MEGQRGTKYKKWQHVQYLSASQGGWIDARVIGVRDDGNVQLDVKEGSWMSCLEQSAKLKEVTKRGFAQGSSLQYYDDHRDCWEDCKVVQLRGEDQSISVDLDPSRWFSMEDQEQRFRPHCRGEAEELMWRAGRLRAAGPDRFYEALALLKQASRLQPYNVRCLDSLAEIFSEQGNKKQAARMLRLALEQDPYDLKVLSDLIELCGEGGERCGTASTPTLRELAQLAKRERVVKNKLRDLRAEGC